MSAPRNEEAEWLGATLRLLRGPRTQVRVARDAGVSPAVWNLWEKGRRKPAAASLKKVRQALGVSRYQFELARWSVVRRRLRAEATRQELENYLKRVSSSLPERELNGETESEEAFTDRFRRLMVRLLPLLEDWIELPRL